MPFFRSKWMLTSKPSTYQRLPDEYVVCDNCMTIAWCLPQDCLTIGKWLADDCHKTAWQLPNDWLTTAWSTIWQDGSLKVWLATATKYPGLRSWVSQPSWRILNRNLYKIHNPPKNSSNYCRNITACCNLTKLTHRGSGFGHGLLLRRWRINLIIEA